MVTLFAASSLLVGSALAMAPAAGASKAPSRVRHGVVAPPADHSAAVLYTQNDNPSGDAISSQNFEASFDAFDAQGADDFTVPTGVKWSVKEVDVSGAYSASGPAASENVFIYRDSAGLPGALVKSVSGVLGIDDGLGNLKIKIGKAKLRPGTYWVSVQVNLDFSVGGQWYWATRTVQSGNAAAWQNPGDGFGSGCTTWGVMETCLFGGPVGEPDFMFTLKGALI
jgi:hypothetical protein